MTSAPAFRERLQCAWWCLLGRPVMFRWKIDFGRCSVEQIPAGTPSLSSHCDFRYPREFLDKLDKDPAVSGHISASQTAAG